MAARVQIKMIVTTPRNELILERQSDLTTSGGETREVLLLLDQLTTVVRRFYEEAD